MQIMFFYIYGHLMGKITMTNKRAGLLLIALIYIISQSDILAQNNVSSNTAPDKAIKTEVPVIINGEAQKIPEFENPDEWIKHDLWVETEFDTDGDGKRDRMHVDVTRPKQTETEGLKLPVIYESSPYFAGTGSTARQYFWNVRHELNTVPPAQAECHG